MTLEQLANENKRLRACAEKYLSWLDVDNAANGLEKDLLDPTMVGSGLIKEFHDLAKNNQTRRGPL